MNYNVLRYFSVLAQVEHYTVAADFVNKPNLKYLSENITKVFAIFIKMCYNHSISSFNFEF